MAKLIVGIGEAVASKNPDDEIKTFALGSCVAVIILDPKTRAGAMVHIALPDSKIDPVKGQQLPGYFADTGLPYLFKLLNKFDANPHAGLIIKLIGGANVLQQQDHFQIGKRNVTAIKKIFWDMNLPITAEDVGENHSRTVTVELKTGKVFVSSSDGREWRV